MVAFKNYFLMGLLLSVSGKIVAEETAVSNIAVPNTSQIAQGQPAEKKNNSSKYMVRLGMMGMAKKQSYNSLSYDESQNEQDNLETRSWGNGEIALGLRATRDLYLLGGVAQRNFRSIDFCYDKKCDPSGVNKYGPKLGIEYQSYTDQNNHTGVIAGTSFELYSFKSEYLQNHSYHIRPYVGPKVQWEDFVLSADAGLQYSKYIHDIDYNGEYGIIQDRVTSSRTIVDFRIAWSYLF